MNKTLTDIDIRAIANSYDLDNAPRIVSFARGLLAAQQPEAPTFEAKHISLKQKGAKLILTLELDGVEGAPRYTVTPINPSVVRPQPEPRAEVAGWQPIETAPKNRSIQLWVPAVGIFIDGPWRGRWSYVAHQWTLDSPLRAPDGRGISVSEVPEPTHWMLLPEAPIDAARAGGA